MRSRDGTKNTFTAAATIAASLLSLLLAWSATSSIILANLACFAVAVSCYLMHSVYDVFNVRRITILSFWYLTYLTTVFLPSFFVYSHHPGPFRTPFLLAVVSTLVTVPLGMVLANRFLASGPAETSTYFDRPIVRLSNGSTFIYLLVFATALLFTAVHIFELRTIPLLYIIRNLGADSREVALLREDALKLLDSRLTYAFWLVRGFVYPVLILYALGLYLETRQACWLRWFIATLIVGLGYAALTLEKSPVAITIVLIGLLVYFYHGGSVTHSTLALFLIGLALPVMMFMTVSYSGNELGLGDALLSTGIRLFYIPADVLYYYFEVFPSEVPFLHGRSIGKLSLLLGLRHFDTSNFVGQYARPSEVTSISFNAAFIGDMHADFGLLGVLLAGIVAGGIMHFAHVSLIRRTKAIDQLACYAILIVVFWRLTCAALPAVMLSHGALCAMCLSWVLGHHRQLPPSRARTSLGT